MNVKEVAKYTGLSRGTIYNFVSQKKIPFQRISEKKVIFDKAEIDEWLKERSGDSSSNETMKFFLKARTTGQINEGENTTIYNQRRKTIIQKISFKKSLLYGSLILLVFSAGWVTSLIFYQQANKIRDKNLSSINKILSQNIDVNSLVENAEIQDLQITPTFTDQNEVKIKLGHINNLELKGNAQSESIMPLLLYALEDRKEDYATRSKTIDVLKPYVDDEKIRRVLIRVMEKDKNPAIRMKSLTVLSKVARIEEVKEAIMNRLMNDEDDGLRFRALEALEKIVDAQILTALLKVKSKDTSKIVRNRAELVYKKHSQGKL